MGRVIPLLILILIFYGSLGHLGVLWRKGLDHGLLCIHHIDSGLLGIQCVDENGHKALSGLLRKFGFKLSFLLKYLYYVLQA